MFFFTSVARLAVDDIMTVAEGFIETGSMAVTAAGKE